jgi:GNAT superfamily N-acetyltransferase
LATIELRRGNAADLPAIARILVDTWRTTFHGRLPAAFLDSLDYRQQEERHRQTMARQDCSYFVAATPSGRLLAFASGGPDRRADARCAAELYAIYVRVESQRKGLGRRLADAVANDQASHGRRSLRVEVLALNPFGRFYQRLGGHAEAADPVELGGKLLEQAAFVWNDIASLRTESWHDTS